MAASERAVVGRAAAIIVALTLGISANSCGEFVRNNPFDPAVPVTLTIQGPDSAFAQFDTLHFTITTDPAYDYDGVEWKIGGFQKLDNNGTYRVFPIEQYNAQPGPVTISATIGPRTATKTVNLVFRPATFRVRSCLDDARDVDLGALDIPIPYCTAAYDRRGGLIGTNVVTPPYGLTIRSLDTAVMKVGGAFPRVLTSVGNGATGVVFTYGPAADTMHFTVRQVLRYVSVSPAACATSLTMSLGDQVQLSWGPPGLDSARQVMADPAPATREAAGMTWSVGPAYGIPTSSVTVSPTGLVTAIATGVGRLVALSSSGTVVPASCDVEVK